MKLHAATLLDAPVGRVWEELQKPALLFHIAAPLVVFRPVDPPVLPARWEEGRYLVSMRLFGILPLGTQWIGIQPPVHEPGPPETYRLHDKGSSGLIRVWDHRITLRDAGAGRTQYADWVEIRAGVMTPLVWLFSKLLFSHRQRRWQRLVAADFRYG